MQKQNQTKQSESPSAGASEPRTEVERLAYWFVGCADCGIMPEEGPKFEAEEDATDYLQDHKVAIHGNDPPAVLETEDAREA